METIVFLVCAGVLVCAWRWGDAVWRWRDRSSPVGLAHAPGSKQRRLELVSTSARDVALGSDQEPGRSRDTQPHAASDRGALLERLAAVEGAPVYDARRKRLGTFIELVGGGSEVAIRHDGVFVWRRRVLPAASVAAVLPEHGARGAVVLNVDDNTSDQPTTQTTHELVHTDERPALAEDQLPSADAEPDLEEEFMSRLAPYTAAPDRSDEDDERVESYLLFVPTAHGYHLVEQDGGAPGVFDDVSLPGDENAYFVIRVGRSPLPGDGRLCAYLEPG